MLIAIWILVLVVDSRDGQILYLSSLADGCSVLGIGRRYIAVRITNAACRGGNMV